MTKLTPEQLAEIAVRRKKIDYTGQWEYIPEGDVVYGGDLPVAEEISHQYYGEFIAASYSDIPALLDHIKALEAEVAGKEYAYQAYKTMYTGHSERQKEKDARIKALEEENARYKDALEEIKKVSTDTHGTKHYRCYRIANQALKG